MIKKLYNLFDKTYKYKFFFLIFFTFFVALLEMLSMGMIIPIAYFFFNSQTSLILSPDSEFFKFFGNIKQKQNQQ